MYIFVVSNSKYSFEDFSTWLEKNKRKVLCLKNNEKTITENLSVFQLNNMTTGNQCSYAVNINKNSLKNLCIKGDFVIASTNLQALECNLADFIIENLEVRKVA